MRRLIYALVACTLLVVLVFLSQRAVLQGPREYSQVVVLNVMSLFLKHSVRRQQSAMSESGDFRLLWLPARPVS